MGPLPCIPLIPFRFPTLSTYLLHLLSSIPVLRFVLSFSMANSTETAAKAATAKAKALAKALRQKNNENSAKFFAAGMVGMICLFMIFHWTRVIFKKYESKHGKFTSFRVPVAVTRYLTSLFHVGAMLMFFQNCQKFPDPQGTRLHIFRPCSLLCRLDCNMPLNSIREPRLVNIERLGKAPRLVSLSIPIPCFSQVTFRSGSPHPISASRHSSP